MYTDSKILENLEPILIDLGFRPGVTWISDLSCSFRFWYKNSHSTFFESKTSIFEKFLEKLTIWYFFSILMFSLISKSRIDLELMEALKSSDFIGGAVAHHLLSHLQLDSGTYLPYLNKKRFKSVKVQRGPVAISYFIYFRYYDPPIMKIYYRLK